MGDSETVVTEPSAVMDYTAAGYASTGYANSGSDVVPGPGDFNVDGTGSFAASTVAAQGGHTGNTYADSSSVAPEARAGMNISAENAAGGGYDSAVNGNVGTEVGVAVSVENGNAGEVLGVAAVEQQLVDGSGMVSQAPLLHVYVMVEVVM